MLNEISLYTYIFCIIISYLLGSIPVAFIAGKFYGVNIFNIGSKKNRASRKTRPILNN